MNTKKSTTTTVHTTKRPRAFDYRQDRFQVRFSWIRDQIWRDRKVPEPNPLRNVGVFVVHGIGEQSDTMTAVSLRRGMEDAKLEPKFPGHQADDYSDVPPPYIYDGFWADYAQLDKLWEKDELETLTTRQKKFFKKTILDRSRGWWKNWWWLIIQTVNLIRKSPVLFWIVYLPLLALVVLLLLLLVIPRFRKLVNDFVNDARLYLQPKGNIELDTVNRIDRRVGSMFLQMLGLDWNFDELPPCENSPPCKGATGDDALDLKHKLCIGHKSHKFEKVIWVAHSLGTVISFNVISDLLWRCKDIRKENSKSKSKENSKIDKVRQVEDGLRHFITLGSPLDKVYFLFPDDKNPVLRPWPEEYLPGGDWDLTRKYSTSDIDVRLAGVEGSVPEESDDSEPKELKVSFWLNFFYGSDPVSGPLDNFVNQKKHNIVKNLSTVGFRPPVVSHVAYWRDVGIISKILELGYAGYVKPFQIKLWNARLHNTLSRMGILLVVVLSVVILIAVFRYRHEVWCWLTELLTNLFTGA